MRLDGFVEYAGTQIWRGTDDAEQFYRMASYARDQMLVIGRTMAEIDSRWRTWLDRWEASLAPNGQPKSGFDAVRTKFAQQCRETKMSLEDASTRIDKLLAQDIACFNSPTYQEQ